LPVVAHQIGNSALLTVSYDDNYSAGKNIQRIDGGVFQYQVPYTDTYGEMDSCVLQFGEIGENPPTYATTIKDGDALPLAEGVAYNGFYGKMQMELVINKESRAIPTINYMLHFVTNRKDIVIGEALPKYSYLCYQNETTWDKEKVSVYVFDRKLRKFEDVLNGGTEIGLLNGQIVDKRYIEYETMQTPIACKSWAVVIQIGDKKHLLFGQNKDIEANSVINLPKLNFTHIIK
jgi:hypothetical protein